MNRRDFLKLIGKSVALVCVPVSIFENQTTNLQGWLNDKEETIGQVCKCGRIHTGPVLTPDEFRDAIIRPAAEALAKSVDEQIMKILLNGKFS